VNGAVQARPGTKRETVLLGRISGAYGIKGWLRIHSDTEPRGAIFDYQPWLIGPTEKPTEIVQGRQQGKYLVAEFEGISDRDTAQSLAGQDIAVYRDQLPELAGFQYYWADLVGLTVFNQDGLELGTVRELIATGANDVMVVRGDKERLIPFIKDMYVTRVDLAAQRVEVNWDPDF
jgi:16S rRNA processing protein RimM